MPAQKRTVNKISSFQNFIDQLVEDKKLPTTIEKERIKEIKKELYKLLQQTIKANILKKFNKKQREEYLEMLQQGKGPKKTQQFIRTHIPEIESLIAKTLLRFRKQYLGKE
jgi:macrodomain Ter protein organizer (MatP/YcbG family)